MCASEVRYLGLGEGGIGYEIGMEPYAGAA